MRSVKLAPLGRGVAGRVAVVLLRDASGDGQTEAVTWLTRVEPNEALEDPLTFVFGHSRPVIGHERLDVAVASL